MRRLPFLLLFAAASAAAAPAPLDESMATPYFTGGDEGDGAQQFALGKYKEALDAWKLARGADAAKKDPARAARLDLMIGTCEENLGQWREAEAAFASAMQGLPLLADYAAFHAARAAYSARDFANARELVGKVAPDSIVGPEAELLAGDLSRAGDPPATQAAVYGAYLKKHPDGPHRSEARFWLASATEKTAPALAIELYRRITIDDPLSSWTAKATARLAALKITDKLTAAEHIARGKELFDSMRNPEGEAEFAAALADPAISAADKCVAAYHAAQSRFKARDRKGAAPMFDASAAACKAAKNVDLEIKSDYQAGRSYSFIGEHDTAVQRYQAAQTVDPKHSYADDAMLREAEEYTYTNQGDKVEATLAALPAKFPDGDNLAEAMWRLGWKAWRDKKPADAITWWQKQIALVPHDDNYFAEGEPQYWLGRAYLATGKKKDAIASWQATIRGYPAAYYALLALNRLRETDAKAYAATLKEISTDPRGYDPKAPAFAFKPRAEWGAPGFQRAMELMRLGLGEPAEQELKKLGLNAPGDKKRVDDPDRIEKLWAIAFLYDRAGRFATSVWPTRWHVLDYRAQWPIGANRARWLIAYPRGYWDILTRHAALNKVPIAMQVAIVREESGFDPLDESYANAIGLTQMIPPTAKDFAKGTGIDPTRDNLRDPEKNVTIGSRFLGSLWKQWNGFALLVPPSYNAGPTGVKRMLKVRGTWDADEFVEGIVDDQARNYTKRVLGTYFTYSWLYDKTVPVIPNKIPVTLLPK